MEKNSSVLKVTIQDTKYRTEGNTIYCDMVVKVNLNSFEQQYHQFTPTFIKKVLSEHLPIVKTVVNYGYSELEPVVAKYYLVPGGPAKVLSFNKKYYKKYYGLDDVELFDVGDLIPVKSIIKTKGECVQYDYCQTFVVTGKAVCLPEDNFDYDKGCLIASSKATLKAANRINKLFETIHVKTDVMLCEIEEAYKNSLEWVKSATKVEETINSTN